MRGFASKKSLRPACGVDDRPALRLGPSPNDAASAMNPDGRKRLRFKGEKNLLVVGFALLG
jgi:hypothetical protein